MLTDLYEGAEEVLRLGHKQTGRNERIAAKQNALGSELDWSDTAFEKYRKRFVDAYWIAEPADVLARNARLVAQADAAGKALSIETHVDPDRAATLVTVYVADHPGLFYRLAGAISVAGANIIDARIHTTRDGMALDNLLIQDPVGGPFEEPQRLQRLVTAIEEAFANRQKMRERLSQRPLPRLRADAFKVEPNVLIDNRASNRYTVVEVNARDRPALLNSLTYALFQSKVTIHSAHIATYGERAVDVFYLTDLTGDKITNAARLKTLERNLIEVAGGKPKSAAKAAA